MELLLLDKDFQICGLLDDFSSLAWNRKYYECGNFSLQISMNYFKQFKNAKYVYSKEFSETGVLETFNYKNTVTGIQAVYTGRFLESKLNQRVIDKTINFYNATTEDIVRSLVNKFAINETDRAIQNLELGTKRGLGQKRTLQMTGDNLLTKIYELCKEDELGIKTWYDFDNNKIVFDVWQGKDRRDTQNTNTWAIFSQNFENVLNEEYSTDKTQYCNFAYVAGEENETTKIRTIQTVDRIKDGEERRELYVDARDLQKDENTTNEQYKQILIERGIEKLNENKRIETVGFSVDNSSNLIYKKDFDLGDKVIYKNEQLGFDIEDRIIEISEVYENGDKTIDIIFGQDFNIKKIKEVI